MRAQLRRLGFILKVSGKRGDAGYLLPKDACLAAAGRMTWRGQNAGIPEIRRLQGPGGETEGKRRPRRGRRRRK